MIALPHLAKFSKRTILDKSASDPNLIGKFEFSPAASLVDIDALVARYDDPECWKKALQADDEDTLPT